MRRMLYAKSLCLHLCEGWTKRDREGSGLYNTGSLRKLFKVSDSNGAKDASNERSCFSESTKTKGALKTMPSWTAFSAKTIKQCLFRVKI